MKIRLLLISLCVSLAFSQVLRAETVKGRIQMVSKQAGTIQIGVKDKKVVIRTDANTKFDGFSSSFGQSAGDPQEEVLRCLKNMARFGVLEQVAVIDRSQAKVLKQVRLLAGNGGVQNLFVA